MTKQSKNMKLTKPAFSKKNLSSEDFLKKVDGMWKPGPQVKYNSPDSWNRTSE